MRVCTSPGPLVISSPRLQASAGNPDILLMLDPQIIEQALSDRQLTRHSAAMRSLARDTERALVGKLKLDLSSTQASQLPQAQVRTPLTSNQA
jgi:hypothetical protein